MTAVCGSNLAVAIHFAEPINLRKINPEQLSVFSQINLEILFPCLSGSLI
jgi:hypothetical protein